MKLATHNLRQFANAFKQLLPQGAAWQWPEGGLGDSIHQGLSKELIRLELSAQDVLDRAVIIHTPAQSNWHIDEYRRVANEVVAAVVEPARQPTKASVAKAGQRLWSANVTNFAIAKVQVDHLVGPAVAGASKAGATVLSERGRYIMRVRYYDTVVDPNTIAQALISFRQAHVFLWLQDITGYQGDILYA